MIISDLHYLEDVNAQESGIVGSGGVKLNTDVRKNIDFNKNSFLNIYKTAYSSTKNVKGNLADSESGADAYGKNTLTETVNFTQSVEGDHSQSYGQSTSASNGY